MSGDVCQCGEAEEREAIRHYLSAYVSPARKGPTNRDDAIFFFMNSIFLFTPFCLRLIFVNNVSKQQGAIL